MRRLEDEEELHRYAHRRNVPWAIHTHGGHVERHLDTFAKYPPVMAAVSLDGPREYHDQFSRDRMVEWTAPGLTITRLRLLSDPGFPWWDVSYCHGQLPDGTLVYVSLPFDRLPKGYAGKLITYLNAAGLNGKRLGIWDAVSTLC